MAFGACPKSSNTDEMGPVRSIAYAALALLAGAAAPLAKAAFGVGGDRSARIAWHRVFASQNDDWVNDLLARRNGNVLAVGFLNRQDGSPPSDWHALAAELSTEGRLIAQHGYGVGQGIDAFWSMAQAEEGRRTFAGFTTRMGGGIDALALQTDDRGVVQWERAFGSGGYDRFTDLAAVSDGYVFLGHSQAAGEEKRRILIVKTDFQGHPVWERIHDALDSWGALYIEPIRGGGFIIAGGTAAGGDSDMFAMKVDSEGRELWRKRVGTADWDEVNHGLVVRPDGAIVLSGYTHRRNEEANDLVAATLSSSGVAQRIERFGGQADDRAILAKADEKGHVWIVGHSASAGAGGSDVLVVRLDFHGRFEPAAITIGGSDDDKGTALLPLADGSLLLAGYSRGLGVGGEDAFVVKLTAPRWDRPNPAFRREVVKP
jgi:hypothetical protein